MLKAYRYRLYPTKIQETLIGKHIGACRFVYNLALETKQYAYASHRKNITAFELMKQLIELKQECPWLKEIDSQALQQSLLDLESAFTCFFKGKSKYPDFRSKKSKKAFRNPHGEQVTLLNGKLIQPKFREGIKIQIDRPHVGQIRSTTIVQTSTNKYFVCVLCEDGSSYPEKYKINSNASVGVDLGLKDFIVTSEGSKVSNPKYLKKGIQRLKVLQRRLRNKKKGSNNQKKAYQRTGLSHEKVANQRKDFLQKLSTKLVRENQTICLEDLNIEGLLKNRNLAPGIADAGWGMFVEMLKYKSEWYGVNFLQIPTFQPSTKICSNCGNMKHDLTLHDRSWVCKCGVEHDRDINAAINIKNYCLRNSPKGIRGVPVELPTLVGAMKQEIAIQ